MSDAETTKIQLAIIAIETKEYKLIRDATAYFEVSRTTLGYRMAGQKTYAEVYETEQLLLNAEENTLARWIICLTATGFPATPFLIKEIAKEIIIRCSVCYKEATLEKISAWFDIFKVYIEERKYNLSNIYNIDEIGFAVIARKQEWITVLECIDTDSGNLLPIIIFKAKNTNTGWIPKDIPSNWHFSTSNSGWTSNSYGFKLLIMDGYSSYITSDIIVLCIDNNIDLLILPPYCSYLLQLLDVGNSTLVNSLDLSVLRSSPPDGTELRYTNSVFNLSMASNDSPALPAWCYTKRMTRLKEVKEYKELLETRKKRTKGKRIKLQGKFVFSIIEVLKIVREAELKSTKKRLYGRLRKRPIEEVEEEEEEEEDKIDSSNLESESEECVVYRTRSSRFE
ncbi:hypothetical protein OIDMADRAFT_46356 [Oidiodendron maius Zn]|uniref:DDE-1 domain-containing protein n=1 Tax=Oidiodendron maius (strain Zn) TaxID=913774 RepID=A0A0C3GS51_OIDMZ|nr:hypothetical protein OIDMADRAFT_46356 [Oidiodendron maius Zn]